VRDIQPPVLSKKQVWFNYSNCQDIYIYKTGEILKREISQERQHSQENPNVYNANLSACLLKAF